MTRMAQRAIVCIDGTYFDSTGKLRLGQGDQSNLYRIYSCAKKGAVKLEDGRINQTTRYFPGINGDSPIKLEERALEVLKYCQSFGCDDELWLFGSGSGALIARAVVHVLSYPELEPKKKKFYEGKTILDKLWKSRSLPHDAPRVRFIGLFDATKDQNLSDNFKIKDDTRVCHAVSIHETMHKLEPDILHDTLNYADHDFVEAWFVGSHIDVAGGATLDGLSLYPLQWILIEAKACGLVLVECGGVESRDEGKRTMQLVLPEAAVSSPWTFRFVNSMTIVMYDIRVSHGEHNLQESKAAPPISRKLQARRSNRNEEESAASDVAGHNIIMNKTDLFEPKMRGKTKSRALFDERNGVSDLVLRGYCGTTNRGVIIHPSVYFLCEVYHKRLDAGRWQPILVKDLHDFRVQFLEQEKEKPYRPWIPPHASRQNEPCRILVCGGTGVGKSTLLNKVFGTELTKVEDMRAGRHDVNMPLESDRHPGLIVHDSRGFEAGTATELKILLKFLRYKLGSEDPRERLDAIWLCIEASTPRPIQEAHKLFLEQIKYLNSPVPLILVYTKMDLVDGFKEDLQGRVRFLKDHVGKILPQAKFQLVTTSSDKIETTKELVRVTLKLVGEHHPEAKPAMVAGIKFKIEEKITFAVAGVIDLLIYDRFASWLVVMEVPLASAAATPILVRSLCERIAKSFGLSKITPKEVSNVLHKLLLQNISRFLAYNVRRDLAQVVTSSASLFGYQKSLMEIIPAALLTLRCAIDLIICLDGAIALHTCDVSIAELRDIQTRYDTELIQKGAGKKAHTKTNGSLRYRSYFQDGT